CYQQSLRREYQKVIHPSHSIKNGLPALIPEMTYEGMEVADGQDAGFSWESLVRGSLDQAQRDRIRKALLEYCGQDTLALVVSTRRLLLAAPHGHGNF